MWSMSVLDMMAQGKCVLVPNKNAFPEMFGEDYPFYFNNKQEFVEKFELLQTIDETELLAWGHILKARVRDRYSWDTHAKHLSNLFIDSLTTKKSNKAKEIAKIINSYNAITKGDLINKSMTGFNRRCSRAWNKCRVDLMANYGIKDDINNEYTIFYKNSARYNKNGIEKRGGNQNQLSIYDSL